MAPRGAVQNVKAMVGALLPSDGLVLLTMTTVIRSNQLSHSIMGEPVAMGCYFWVSVCDMLDLPAVEYQYSPM